MHAPDPSSLNGPQTEAVSTLRGPLLVLAGAGTGKTRVLTFRIVRLIRSGIAANRILAVTFTNKAAREMRERALALLPGRKEVTPEISTFHSLCVRILRRRIHHLGYPRRFVIYDRSDQESVARATLRELRVPNESLKPSDLLAAVGRWKNRGVEPEAAEHESHSDRDFLAARAYRRYQEALCSRAAVDFDDLLLLTRKLLEDHEDIAREEAARFDHVLVDEYQDTNGPQYRILRALATPHRNLCVVGDDDQSIYGWRGADVEHILGFERDWPGAKVVRLEDNYRSTPGILALSNRLIQHNSTRHDKVLRANLRDGPEPRFALFADEEAEAKGVIRDIEARLGEQGVQPRDLAVLFRTNEQPRAFEFEFRKKQIPYRLVGGMSFWDRKEVRDVLAYLRILVQPKDEASMLRVINTPPRGLGKTVIKKMVDRAIDAGKPLWEVLPELREAESLTPQSQRAVGTFVQLIEGERQKLRQLPAPQVVRRLLEDIGYRAEIERLHDDPLDREARWASVEEVVNALAQHVSRPDHDIETFLQETSLAERGDEADDKSNAVMLMTLHSAKGLEFSQVYLVGMEEGLLPHERSLSGGIDEERRLCYVGVTRAQERITLTLAEKRRKWGVARERVPSRFLYEMADLSEHPKLGPMKAKQAAAGGGRGRPRPNKAPPKRGGGRRQLRQRK